MTLVEMTVVVMEMIIEEGRSSREGVVYNSGFVALYIPIIAILTRTPSMQPLHHQCI